jgi:hypothetical protein
MDAKRKGPRGSIGTRPQKPSGGRASENQGHGAKPDAVRDKAILSLLSEKTIGAAALQCGVNERTLRRWLTEDATFKAEYDTARTATFQAGINRVQGLTTKAANTLEDLLDAEKHPAVRLGAARTVVEIGMNRHDADTILRTLDEIEQRQQGRY